MSQKHAMLALYFEGLTATQRHVLLALAVFTDPDGSAWPSTATVVRVTGLNVKTVRKALDDLEAAGVITCSRRFRPDGSQTSNRYELCLEREGGVPASGRGASPPLGGLEHAVNSTTTTARAKPKHVIPEAWEPDERCRASLAKEGIPEPFWRELLNEFRLYWIERREKRPGWSATFLNHAKSRWKRSKEAPDAARQPAHRPRGFARGDEVGNQFLREHGVDPHKVG